MKKGAKKQLESSDSRNKLEVTAAEVKKSHTKAKESHHHRSKDRKEDQKPKESREHKPKEHKPREREHKSKEPEKDREQPETSRQKDKEQQPKAKEKPAATVDSKNGAPERVLHEDTAGIGRNFTKYERDLKRNTKPPVVLVYSDSVVARDSVKHVLHEILNREK